MFTNDPPLTFLRITHCSRPCIIGCYTCESSYTIHSFIYSVVRWSARIKFHYFSDNTSSGYFAIFHKSEFFKLQFLNVSHGQKYIVQKRRYTQCVCWTVGAHRHKNAQMLPPHRKWMVRSEIRSSCKCNLLRIKLIFFLCVSHSLFPLLSARVFIEQKYIFPSMSSPLQSLIHFGRCCRFQCIAYVNWVIALCPALLRSANRSSFFFCHLIIWH